MSDEPMGEWSNLYLYGFEQGWTQAMKATPDFDDIRDAALEDGNRAGWAEALRWLYKVYWDRGSEGLTEALINAYWSLGARDVE